MTVDKQESLIFQAKISKKTPMVVSGKGVRIIVEDPETKERREIVDGLTGAAVGALGWGDEDMAVAIAEAGKESVYSYPAYLGNYWAEKLAAFYINNSPPGAFAAALFTCSGSESNENALKIIRQYFLEKGETKRVKFISRKQSYHGYTIGALSIGDNGRKTQFQDILMPASITPKLSPCYYYRNAKEGETVEEYKDRLLQEAEDMFQKEDPETVAAVIVETMSGSSIGTVTPVPGYLEGLRDICHKYGALFMLDEVMCGTGRCSKGLNCWENFLPLDKGPDLQTIGKTLGSGYVTIAGVLVSPKVRDVFVNGSGMIIGAQTYHSHAFNCRVALAVQEKIKANKYTENIFEMGNYMGEQLSKILSQKSAIVGNVRGIGGFWSLEFVKDKTTKEPIDPKFTTGYRVQYKCYDNGVTSMGMGGTTDGVKYGDHLCLAPCFIITKEDVDDIVERVTKSVLEVEAELKAEGAL